MRLNTSLFEFLTAAKNKAIVFFFLADNTREYFELHCIRGSKKCEQ